MLLKELQNGAEQLGQTIHQLNGQFGNLKEMVNVCVSFSPENTSFLMLITIFVLAIFVGYYVVWRVTPALHSPLMGVTNALSSVVIVGALLGAGLSSEMPVARFFGFCATVCAAVNIVGGFFVTYRMLDMFRKSKSS